MAFVSLSLILVDLYAFSNLPEIGLTAPLPQFIWTLQKVTPVWHALDVRYDQCVGHCACLPGRDVSIL